MEKRLFLVASFVCLGLTFVQLGNAANIQPSGIRENFRNFFDLIKQNDIQKTEAFRSFLEEEEEKEQHTFDMVKDELRITRQRNVNRLRNLQHNGEIGERAAAVKREAEADAKTAQPSLDHSEVPPARSTARVKVSTEYDSVETFKKKMNRKIGAMPKEVRDAARELHAEWYGRAQKVETKLNTDLGVLADENLKLKCKTAIRNEIQRQFDKLAPNWLIRLNIKRRWKWRLLFQLETSATNQLKSIVLEYTSLTLEQFCNEMEDCAELAAVDIHLEELPYFHTEEQMDAILISLGFKRKSLRDSLIALAFKFRQQTEKDFYKDDKKFVFLHFPALKWDITEAEIAQFLNHYVKKVEEKYITIITINPSESTRGGNPSTVQAFVRFCREEDGVIAALETMISETELQMKPQKTQEEKKQLEKEKMKFPDKSKLLMAGKQQLSLPKILT